MKGLIDSKPQGPATDEQPAQQEQPAQEEGEQASKEEQEAFTRVEAAAMEIVYGEKTSDALLQQLQAGADDPAKVLGETAMMVFSQIDEKSGGGIPETVVLQGALKVLDLVTELATESGVLQVDESVMQQAVNQMLISASEMGYITEGDIPAIQEMIQQMPQEEVQGIVSQQQQMMGGT